MAAPKISIIIVYNTKTNLKECIESAVQQSYSNIEAVCVNNGSKDGAEDAALELASKIDRIKLLSLPAGVSDLAAKRAGIAAADGNYIVFIDNNEITAPDFIKNAYIELNKDENAPIKSKYLYRRAYLENDREISALVSSAAEKIKSEQDEKISSEFDKYGKNTAECIQNKTNETRNRINELQQQTDEKINNIYEDIKKVYDYINSEINKKGCEINAVYDEITKNYKYTEELAREKTHHAIAEAKTADYEIKEKLDNLEKEIVLRYTNLKRIMDIQLDEIRAKIQSENKPV